MFIFATHQQENMENKITTNSFKAWLLAARPKTLTGASVPVMIATAMAFSTAKLSIQVIPAVLCFLFAFIMQIDANFINDYFDFVRGNDDETRLGPKRACAQGWISLNAMKVGIAVTTIIACLIGLPLIFFGGWEMIIVGVLCVLFCFLYTTSLSYLGLGDLLVLVFFGIVPVCLSYYLEMPDGMKSIPATVVIASIACGLVIDTLLVVNNFRDIDNDIRAGKKTLVVRLGAARSLRLYLALGVAAWALGFAHFSEHPFAALLPIIYIAFHVKTWLRMKAIAKGKALNMILGETARNMFIYGLLTALGFLIS
jgi:1,4-dihydroxy-2-naphthoate octaprenyltransferase